MLFLHKVPKNHSILWALNAHVMSSECSSVDPSMPISWSVCAHQTSTDKRIYRIRLALTKMSKGIEKHLYLNKCFSLIG